MYRAEKKIISVSGVATLGWQLGYGYRQEKMTVKVEKWCVIQDGEKKPICTCIGKKQAEQIANSMNFTHD